MTNPREEFEKETGENACTFGRGFSFASIDYAEWLETKYTAQQERIKSLDIECKKLSGGFVDSTMKFSVLRNVLDCMVKIIGDTPYNKSLQKTVTKDKLLQTISELYEIAEEALKEKSWPN